MATNNSDNISAAGLVKYDGTGTFTGVTVTDHAPLVGATSNGITSVGPLTNGQLLIGSTGADPVAASLTQPAAGLTITGGAGSSTFALADDLAAVEGIATTGMVARTAANTWTTRTLTAGTGISISNGDGVSGNPTISATASGGTVFTKFTANGTWNKNANTKAITIIMWGGGGGGGSGRRGAAGANRTGGGGGAAGGVVVYFNMDPSFFGSSESVVVGAGGTGGAAITVDDTNGNAGAQGNYSAVGSLTTVQTNLSSTGGGGGTNLSASAGPALPFYSYLAALMNAPSSGSSLTTAPQDGSSVGVNPYFSYYTPSGSGGGGNITAANAAQNGGAGGAIKIIGTSTDYVAAAAGGIVGGTVNGGNGAHASLKTSGAIQIAGTGGGGGAASNSGAAGNGGNGGIPGGPGGGGGASLNGNNSGAGGNGARGEVWIIEYL